MEINMHAGANARYVPYTWHMSNEPVMPVYILYSDTFQQKTHYLFDDVSTTDHVTLLWHLVIQHRPDVR